MYYQQQKALLEGGVLDSREEVWVEDIKRQLCWTKGTRHRVTHKKMAEPKIDIKARVGKSPDVADGAVLCFAYDIIDKLPQNEIGEDGQFSQLGSGAMTMGNHPDNYYGSDDGLYD